MRLVRHVAPGQTSAKAVALRTMIRTEFRKPLTAGATTTTRDELLEARKASAVRALSNYMLQVAAPQDDKLKSTMQNFHGRAVKEAKQVQNSKQSAQLKQPSDTDESTTRNN